MGCLLAKMVKQFCCPLLLSLVTIKAEFSPELQEAIDFCGGISALTDGNCPANPIPIDSSGLDKTLKNAKNVKLGLGIDEDDEADAAVADDTDMPPLEGES